MKILILIPAFNESKNIENLMKRVNQISYDYLIINDCSSDNTKQILEDNKLNHISLCNNMGIANVLQAGYRYAFENGYDAVATIDGDGQHNPEYIDELLLQLDKGNDYVIGSRFVNQKKPWSSRMLGSRIICFCIKLVTGVKVNDPTSGMKVVGNKLLREFSINNNFIAEPDTLVFIIKNGYKFKEVQVEMEERIEGVSHFKSSFNSLKYMVYVLSSIIFIQSRKYKRV